MTQKTTKRTLVTSATSLLLCCAMLIGTTFAWFTDSVSSGINTIKSGNLDIKLEYLNGNEWKEVTENTVLFEGEKWEPGHTRTVSLKITNKGNLALKYKLSLDVNSTTGKNIYGDAINLSNYLAVGFTDTVSDRNSVTTESLNTLSENPSHTGELLEKDNNAVVHLTVTMPTDVGNEANAKDGEAPEVKFGLNLLATQKEYENDSFGNEYDKDASLDFVPVANETELKEAIENGAKSVSLSEDINLVNRLDVTGDLTIVGNGHTLTSDKDRVINVNEVENVNIVLSGVKLDNSDAERALSIYGSKNVKVDVINSEMYAQHYAFNIASGNEGIVINVENSKIKGYAAFQSWSDGVTATFNNSILIGHNKWVKNEWNNFATIVVNENVKNNEYTFNNCEIHADNEPHYNEQKHYDDRGTENDLAFNGCTYFQNGIELEEAIK